jgi:hypothetical protein
MELHHFHHCFSVLVCLKRLLVGLSKTSDQGFFSSESSDIFVIISCYFHVSRYKILYKSPSRPSN